MSFKRKFLEKVN